MPTAPTPHPQTRLPWTTWLSGWLPPALWAVAIFVLSAQQTLPGLEATALDFLLKKGAHITVYAGLYFLLYRGVAMVTTARHERRRLWVPLVLTLMYAVLDELHQSFVPGRSATLVDIGYDTLGAGLVWLKVYDYV